MTIKTPQDLQTILLEAAFFVSQMNPQLDKMRADYLNLSTEYDKVSKELAAIKEANAKKE
jgi:hypothetical protein